MHLLQGIMTANEQGNKTILGAVKAPSGRLTFQCDFIPFLFLNRNIAKYPEQTPTPIPLMASMQHRSGPSVALPMTRSIGFRS